jgi:hypothetical protein
MIKTIQDLSQMTYTDTLNGHGKYSYYVTKRYINPEGESEPSDTVNVSYFEKVTFTVRDSEANKPLKGAKIVFDESATLQTNSDGKASIDTGKGTYEYVITKPGYNEYKDIVLVNDQDKQIDVNLEAEYQTVTFNVTCSDGPVAGAQLIFEDQTFTTKANGSISLDTTIGNYDYEIKKKGYLSETGRIRIVDSSITKDIVLNKKEYSITFNVKAEESEKSVENATVIVGNTLEIATNQNGEAKLDTISGEYNYKVEADGFETASGSITLGYADSTVVVTLKQSATAISQLTRRELRLYPNPSTGQFTMELDNRIKDASVSIFNAEGKQVFSHNYHNLKSSRVNLEQVPAGLYYIVIRTSSGTINKKLIIE